MAQTTEKLPDILRPSHVMLRSRGAVVGFLVAAVVLGLLAGFAHEWLLNVDEPISDWIRSPGNDSDLWRAVSLLGSEWLTLTVLGGLAVPLWKICKPVAIGLPVVVVVAAVTNIVLKLIIDRPRPESSIVGTALASFPSGHVIQSVILLGLLPPVLWLLTGKRSVFRIAMAGFVIGVPWVAASRVALGAHWPSDVVGSLFVGAALLLGTEYAITSSLARSRCDSCALHQP